MPLPFTLPELENTMNIQIEQLGGIDAAIEACDRMYSAAFRGEAVKLSSCYDWEDEVKSIYHEVASALYAKSTGQQEPQRDHVNCGCYHDCDCTRDSFMYASESFIDSSEHWMEKNHPEFVINGDSLVVDFCNYKGEGGDDLGLYELHKHLPIFKSKSHSFNQVN